MSTPQGYPIVYSLQLTLGPALHALANLFEGESYRSQLAAHVSAIPKELRNNDEEWQEDDSTPGIVSKSPTFDAGMYQSMVSMTRSIINNFHPNDPDQQAQIRDLLGIGAKLCRERYSLHTERQLSDAQGWLFVLNQLNLALKKLQAIDSQTIDPNEPDQNKDPSG